MTREEYRQNASQFNRRPKKLNAEQVRDIRCNVKGRTLEQLAAQYGVHRNTVYRICQGITWSNV